MSQQRLFPFRRVSVDNMVRGVTRVWWQLERAFNDPGPYVFQLQYSNTGLRDSPDWHNVGTPLTDGYVAFDDAWRTTGSELTLHYRVTLTTLKDIYVSQAVSCLGELPERDWLIAREVVRKEQLRHKYVSVEGYLLKPYRYGRPCTRCRDVLTQEVVDSQCPICNGTGFEVGFHPPLPMQCWDLSNQTISVHQDGNIKGTTRENAEVTARVIGWPALNRDDIWVNGSSDERWLIHDIQVAAALRGVPIVYTVRMGLLPFSNPAYAIEVGGEPAERPGPDLPVIGCGNIVIDHNYGGADNLAYKDATDCPVVGASVYVFAKAVFDAAHPDFPARANAIANTTTRANGRWTDALRLDAGDYAVLFEKPGEYGPDYHLISVVPENAESSCAWIPAMELGGDETSDTLIGEQSETIGQEQTDKVCGPRGDDDFWNF